MTSFRNDAWFAGFTDGEGCFLIAPQNGDGLTARFVISLRADDLAVLEDLRADFGGTISMRHDRGNPVASWYVCHKRDLAGLIEYFDRFPLRAKKARDYVIWRRAAVIYSVHGFRAPELRPLKEALSAGRKYAADDQEEAATVVDRPQLRLVS